MGSPQNTTQWGVSKLEEKKNSFSSGGVKAGWYLFIFKEQ